MTKDVLISIVGLQFVEEDSKPDSVEVINVGKYYKKNGSHYILYDEVTEETGGINKNRIKIELEKNRVLIYKSGSSAMNMIFEEGRKNHTYFDTPAGSLQISILADNIRITDSENEINLHIHYLLEVNNQTMSNCTVQIKVIPKSKANFSFDAPQ